MELAVKSLALGRLRPKPMSFRLHCSKVAANPGVLPLLPSRNVSSMLVKLIKGRPNAERPSFEAELEFASN